MFERGFLEELGCVLEWDRDPPRYPLQSLNRGDIGGVIIGYDLSDDGRVENARVLGEVPRAIFGERAISSMKEWRLASPPPNNPDCRKNITIQFTFIISN